MLVTQAGAITFPFDKPEQVIDFFVGYLKSCGLDSSFVLGLQIRPYAIYDEDVEAWNMLDSLSSTKQGERIYLSTSTTASRASKPASAEMVPEDTFEQTLLRRTTSPSVAFLSSLARGEEVEMDAETSKEREAGLEPAPSETTRPKRDTRPTNAKQRGKAKAEEELETLSSSAQPPPIQPAHKVASCWMWNCAVTEDCLLVSEMAQAVAFMRSEWSSFAYLPLVLAHQKAIFYLDDGDCSHAFSYEHWYLIFIRNDL
ncbi:unnamed protein product [Schistocephalus solidus]|uniref:UBX domain-containing protein n=1 Tax=Schistocephalus solidus TaxID=70667 RepID=A0A183TC39_SCHSO|nr:unnamed protein product [Schistocephalus solidus]